MKRIFYSLVLLIILSSIGNTQELPSVTFPYGNYLKSIFTIIIVMVGLLFVLKILTRGNRFSGTNARFIQVIDRVQLESQVALYLIKMKDKTWLVSVGSKNTSVIDDVSELVSDIEPQKPFSFKETLDRIVKKNDQEK